MKKLSIIPLLLYILCSFNVNATETECFWKSKTPWQKMLTVLYNHGIDTAGMTVMTQVSCNILKEASDELDKKFGIKEGVIDWSACSENVRVGDAICEYMLIKYQNKSGEKYDYYKVRYSNNDYDFWSFLDKYPESRYSEELRQKKNCVEVCFLWRKMGEKTSGGDIVAMGHAFYKKSQKIESCNYEGFSPLVEDIKKYMKTVEDWDGLIAKRRKIKNYDDYSSFILFKDEHVDYLSSYQILVDDSIAQCKHNIAWKKARETNTIAAYRDYLSSCPKGEHVDEVKKKIRDYEDWMTTKEAGNHIAFVTYCSNHLDGDSIFAAKESMRLIEESEWRRLSADYEQSMKKRAKVSLKTKTLKSVDSFLDKYKDGYYYSKAADMQCKLIEAIQGSSISDTTFFHGGRCSSPYVGVVFIGNVRKSDNDLTVTLKNRETNRVYRRTIKHGKYWTDTIPNGIYSIVVSCWDADQNFAGTFTVSGRLSYLTICTTLKDQDGVVIEKDYDKGAEKKMWEAFGDIWCREDYYGYLNEYKFIIF